MKEDDSLKMLIASDNHADDTRLYDLLSIYNDIDLWLHCGDSEFYIDNELWDSYKTVRGNMDWENKFPEVRSEKASDFNVVVLHGHRHQVKNTNSLMLDEAVENDAKIVFYGHTHVAKVEKEQGIYFINPGSISQPRGDLRVGSYAIYEKNNEGEKISFYDWNHNELPELSQKLN